MFIALFTLKLIQYNYLFLGMISYILNLCIETYFSLQIFNYSYISFQIFQLFSEMLKISEAIEGFIYLIALLFTVYINFYMGQLLVNHSNAAFSEL